MMRMTRAAVINVLSHPYIEMARLKGCSPGQIVLRHAFINAVGPIINVVAISLAYLVVGVVVVEVIFTYPAWANGWWTPCPSATSRWCRSAAWSSAPPISA